MTAHDPAMIGSAFARNPRDAYYTEAAVTAALARRIPKYVKTIWEPACGRGDMAREFCKMRFSVFCSDLHIGEMVKGHGALAVEQSNFLDDMDIPNFWNDGIDAICTNPPFGDDAERFIRQALTFTNIRFFAFVLRAEWNHGKSRLDLFTKEPYAGEIVLTWRPRWDWWLTPEEKVAAKITAGKTADAPDSSPRHNFSIQMWDREHIGPPTIQFATRDH